MLQIAHNKLKPGTLVKIINVKTNDSVVLKNNKKFHYPEFYKILITKPVAEEINLEVNLPLVEIIEVKKNKSFVILQISNICLSILWFERVSDFPIEQFERYHG